MFNKTTAEWASHQGGRCRSTVPLFFKHCTSQNVLVQGQCRTTRKSLENFHPC